jgi:hypothetical protein
MKWNFKSIAIGIFSVLLATPVQAAMDEAEQITAWYSQLGRSYCAENWTEALSLAGALLGSDVTPHERVWLYLLRQDMFNYRSGAAEFNGCDGSPIMAGITGQEALSESRSSSLNWHRDGSIASRRNSLTTRSMLRTNRSQPINTTLPPTTALSSVQSSQATDTACPPVYERDRRVANGTVSNRWAYEIWQDNGGFRARYWQQSQTCSQSRTTGRYSTQNEAYQEFRRAATYNESRGVLQGN